MKNQSKVSFLFENNNSIFLEIPLFSFLNSILLLALFINPVFGQGTKKQENFDFIQISQFESPKLFDFFVEKLRKQTEPIVKNALNIKLSLDDRVKLDDLERACISVMGHQMKDYFRATEPAPLRATLGFSITHDKHPGHFLWESLGFKSPPIEGFLRFKRPLEILKKANWSMDDLERMANIYSKPFFALNMVENKGDDGWHGLWCRFISGISLGVFLPGDHLDLTSKLWASLGLDDISRVDGTAWHLESQLKKNTSWLGAWQSYMEDLRKYLDDENDAPLPMIKKSSSLVEISDKAILEAVNLWPMPRLDIQDRNVVIRHFLAYFTLDRYSEIRLRASGVDGWTDSLKLRELYRDYWRPNGSQARISGIELLGEHSRRFHYSRDLFRVSALRALIWQNPESSNLIGMDFLDPWQLYTKIDDIMAQENLSNIDFRIKNSLLPKARKYRDQLFYSRRDTQSFIARSFRQGNLYDRLELGGRRLMALAIRDRLIRISEISEALMSMAQMEIMENIETTALNKKMSQIKQNHGALLKLVNEGLSLGTSQADQIAQIISSSKI